MKFSEKLFNLRRQYGLSQDDLAIKLDISRQAVYKWENDQSKPELDKLKILSTLFNVSIDNLLDDNADIVLKTTSSRKALGEVVDLKTPDADMAERVNTAYSEEDSNKIKTRKTLIKSSLIAIWIAIAMLILSIVIVVTGEEWNKLDDFAMSFMLPLGFVVFIIALIVYKVTDKWVYSNVSSERTYFNTLKANGENYLKSKGYEYVMLQKDLPVWFFYDVVGNSKLGVYFEEKEQFVCPIQNYINLSYEKMQLEEFAAYKVSFSYYDQNGVVKDYTFMLSPIRKYIIDILVDKGMYDKDYVDNYVHEISKETLKTITGIKSSLEIKKLN